MAARTGPVASAQAIRVDTTRRKAPLAFWSKGRGTSTVTWKVQGETGRTVFLQADAAHGWTGRWVMTDFRVLSPEEAALVEAASERDWLLVPVNPPTRLRRDPTDEPPKELLRHPAIRERAGAVKDIRPTASSIATADSAVVDFIQTTTYRIDGVKGVLYADVTASKAEGRWHLTGYSFYPPAVIAELERLRAPAGS